MRLLGRCVAAKPPRFSVDRYLSAVRLLAQPRHVANTFKTCAIGLLAVSAVLGVGRLAQVLEPVVVTFPVDVVKLIFRPTTRHIEPRQPVLGIAATVNFDVAVAPMVTAARARTNTDFGARQTPSEVAGCGVVTQNFADVGGGDHHYILPGPVKDFNPVNA